MTISQYFLKLGEEQFRVKDSKFKILTPKQMLQRLPIAAAHVKTSNPSENLLKEFRQTMYYLHRTKEITKIL